MRERTQILSLISVSSFGNFLPLAILPVLLGYYDPAAFGKLAIFNSTIIVAAELLSFKYDQAILVSRNTEQTTQLVLLSSVLVLINCLVVFFFAALFRGMLGLTMYDLILAVAGILLYFSTRILVLVSNRNLNIKLMNLSSTMPLILYSIIAVIFGLFDLIGANTLIYAKLLGFLFTLFFLSFPVFKGIRIDLQVLSYRNVVDCVYEYIDYPKRILLGKSMNVLVKNGINFALGFLYGNYFLGLFSIARRILALPEMIIGRPLDNYFRRKVFVNDLVSNSEIKRIQSFYLKRLVGIAVLFFLVCSVLLPFCIRLLKYDNDWFAALPILQLLTLGYCVSFITVPFMSFFRVLKLEDKELKFQVLNFVSMAILLLTVQYGALGEEAAMVMLNIQRVIVFSWFLVMVIRTTNRLTLKDS